MFATTLRRHLARLAILAVLLNALVPTVSQALAFAQRGDARTAAWVEICSSEGSRWILRGPDGDVVQESASRPDEAPAALHGAACLYCLPHAASWALTPPQSLAVLPALEAAQVALPTTFVRSPRPPPWVMPAVRAPPAPAR